MVYFWRNFWIRETGTGQQVAQLHERYMMMMMMMMMMMVILIPCSWVLFDKLIFTYVVGSLPARCGALIAVLLRKRTFWNMTLSSSEYFSTFRLIIVLLSSGPDILHGQLISEYKRTIFHIRTFKEYLNLCSRPTYAHRLNMFIIYSLLRTCFSRCCDHRLVNLHKNTDKLQQIAILCK